MSEPGEEVELLAPQLDRAPVEQHAPGRDVDDEPVDADDLRRRRGPRAAEDRAHARHDLAHAEGLDDVVVGAELEPDDPVGLRPAGGDHDDRDVRAAPQLSADVAAVAVGQAQVEQHEVGPLLGGGAQRVGRRGGQDRAEPLALERVPERLRDRRLVLDEEDRVAPPGVHRGRC